MALPMFAVTVSTTTRIQLLAAWEISLSDINLQLRDGMGTSGAFGVHVYGLVCG